MAKKPKVKKIVTYTATSEDHGVQASGPTEKKALELLEKAIEEKFEFLRLHQNESQ